jgi:transcriptional regulator GlxA family with amidase domain
LERRAQAPWQWCGMLRRIEHVRRLLVSTEFAIVEIADSCGFADQAHMNKCVMRVVGETPGRVRRAHQ